MRIAEDNVGAHRHQLVGEEEAPFVHFLVKDHGTPCLCCRHNRNGHQIGGERRPWSAPDAADAVAEVECHCEIVLIFDDKVVFSDGGLNPDPGQGLKNKTEIVDVDISDRDFALCDSPETEIATDFHKVWADSVS